MEIEPVDLSQNIENDLSKYADEQRKKLVPKNEYKQKAFEYSSVNKDAMADGDSKGRGTGIFLDVYNSTAGTIEDVSERKSEVKINQYSAVKTYPNF